MGQQASLLATAPEQQEARSGRRAQGPPCCVRATERGTRQTGDTSTGTAPASSADIPCCGPRGRGDEDPFLIEKRTPPSPTSSPTSTTKRSRHGDAYMGISECSVGTECFGGDDSIDNNPDFSSRGGDDKQARECGAIGVENDGKERYDPFCNIACGLRTIDQGEQSSISKHALFGEKCLKPKLLRLHALEEEVTTLRQTRSKLQARLAGEDISIGTVAATNSLCISDWVPRIMAHEEAMSGVPARLVKEACSGALGNTSQLVAPSVVNAHYKDIVDAVDKLTFDRSEIVNTELDKLDKEIGDIEELIILCFEKMDENCCDSITRDRFVEFVSGGCDEKSCSSAGVEPKDAACLFNQMSKGEAEINFENFKDEMTHGCLQALRGNIDLRRTLKKRYRDHWF